MKNFIKLGKSFANLVLGKIQNKKNTNKQNSNKEDPNKEVCCQERNDHGFPCVCLGDNIEKKK